VLDFPLKTYFRSIAFLLVSCGSVLAAQSPRSLTPADIVNPNIGVLGNGDGSVVIGPTLPHGSIHPSPDTAAGGESGYRSDRPIRGFSQLHASGTGWGNYGNLLISPQIGLDVAPDGHDSAKADEQAESYSYRVRLSRYNIVTELSPTEHAAIYRFTFPASDQSHLLLDLGQQIPGQLGTKPGDGKVVDSEIHMDPKDGSFSGSSCYSGGWSVGKYTVYFYGQIKQRPVETGTWNNANIASNATSARWTKDGDRIGGWWRFSTNADAPVLLKIGVSFRSIERAREYIAEEIPAWDYQRVRSAARQAWNDALGSIAITGGDETQRKIFYTALYHAQIMPRDRTGDFERFASNQPMWDDFYATWDVWRTKFPLMLWIDPALVRGAISSFHARLEVDGQVRDSFVAGYGGPGPEVARTIFAGDRDIQQPDQGGNDIDNIIADAYSKGLRGVDWEKAYEVLKFDADHERQGNFVEGAEDYRRQGWIRTGLNAVSNTLEYAYNDYAVAQVASGLGKTEDAQRYFGRARQWQNLFNPAIESDGFKGFVMPRRLDGSWVPFDPKQYGGSWKSDFAEATSWTYSFFVPHQVGRLIEMMGGPKTFARRLDHANSVPLIDFFNEPGFLAPTLFQYAGRPDLSSKWMHRFAGDRYSLRGYPGDDDSGAMSSYYVWVSMGIFPNAGQDIYLLSGPLYDKIVVHRPEDGLLTITRTGNGEYIASATIDGKPLDRAWVHHRELNGDTVLAFTMSVEPTDWGKRIPPPSDKERAQPLP
jgi:predicted alpha-1,2-mannosidase